MTTISANQPIWNMVKAANPGANDSEIWKKTDAVLKEHNITWDSAKKGQTADGKSNQAEKEKIAKELSGETAPKVATTTAASTTAVSSAGITATSATSVDQIYQNIINQQQQAAKNPLSFNAFLSGTNANAANSNALAARTANFASIASGQNILRNNNSLFATDPNLFLGILGYNQNDLTSLYYNA